jgi:hypothetical protein
MIMNGESVNIWKEAAVVFFKVQHSSDETEKKKTQNI